MSGRTIFIGILILIGVGTSVYAYFNPRNHVEPVDEALLRVPIPPQPESPQPEAVEENISETQLANEESEEIVAADLDSENTVEDTSSVTPRRTLPGMASVSSVITDPTTECVSGDTRTRFKCYSDYLTRMVQEESIEAAFVNLKRFYNQNDSFTVTQCHQLTHVIGRAATLVFPTVAEAYNHGDAFCWSGYHHGIMEAVIADIGLEAVPEHINNICSELPGKDSYSFDYFNCVHGLGHGIMYTEGHDLFASLELCDTLEGWWEQSSCYGGVFMENVIANEIDHFSEYLKEDDLLYPCNAVAETYKGQCYLMHTSHMLKVNGYDYADVFLQCERADPGHVNTCYQSLGRDASGLSTSNQELTTERCLLGPNENAVSNCVIGAVKDFVSYYHSDVEARAFCEGLPSEYQETCLTTMEWYYVSFN